MTLYPQQEAELFRKRLAAGETLFGCFLSFGSPVSAELMAWAGYDWSIIDLEHGSRGEADVLPQLQALAGTGCAGFIRVETEDRPRIGRVLDMGAPGIMFPRIDTPEQAAAAVSGMRYPPKGIRGVGFSNRSAGYGTNFRPYLEASENLLTIIQIESEAAVQSARQIAAVPGVDILFVGPTDLSFSMGMLGEWENPRFLAHMEHVAASAILEGKVPGMLLPTPDHFDRFHAMGYRFLASGADVVLLNNAATTNIGKLHASRAAATRDLG